MNNKVQIRCILNSNQICIILMIDDDDDDKITKICVE